MKIEFIISSHKHPQHLMTILSSLTSQTNDNWVAHVFADGVFDGYQKVKDYFKDDVRFKFTEIDGPSGDWGNTPRNIALKELREEWVVMSGDDNYYTPVFVEQFLNQVINDNVHFVFCNMIHSHMGYTGVINSMPMVNHIDIGNFMSRSKFSSQLQINNKSTTGDGEFVELYLRTFNGEIRHIPKVLYVHN